LRQAPQVWAKLTAVPSFLQGGFYNTLFGNPASKPAAPVNRIQNEEKQTRKTSLKNPTALYNTLMSDQSKH
jgi:hypothetical protein